MGKLKKDTRKWLKRNRVAVFGWVLAAVFLALWMGKPRVKTVEKTVWKESRVVNTAATTHSDLVAGPDAVTTVNPDGTLKIEGGFTLKSTRSETGKDVTESEGHTTKTTTPVAWTGRIGASLLIPPPFKMDQMKKQLEADWNVGSLFGFDVGAGGRVVFPAGGWSVDYYGVAVSITF